VPSPTRDDAACAPGFSCVEDATGANTCRADACGDGFLPYGGLDCDDGNTADGDGCSSTCEPMDEGAGGADCASAVTLGFPRVRWLSSESIYLAGAGGDVVAGSDLAPGCATGAGPEAVYVVDLPVRASLDVSATGVDDVSVRSADAACGLPELGCTAGSATASSVDLSLPDLAPGRYLVLLDRESPSAATAAAYSLVLMATPL
jgi:cysteine-rich repeat protein